MDEEGDACWVCGRALEAEEPRRLVPNLPDDPATPPSMTGIACLACYRGREQTYVPGAAKGRLTSRVLIIPTTAFAS